MIGIFANRMPSVRIDGPRVYIRPPRRRDERQWVEIRRISRDFLVPWEPAWPGDDPQQAVSPGPGMAAEAVPDRDEWADMSFLRLPLPQRSQQTVVFSVKTRISATCPQSAHKKSKSGMRPSFFP